MRERGARIERAIDVCRAAWGTGLVQPEGVAVTPKPARDGGPPIWIGAEVEQAVRRAARLADGWMAGEPDVESFRGGVAWVRDELRSVGRDQAEFESPAIGRSSLQTLPAPGMSFAPTCGTWNGSTRTHSSPRKGRRRAPLSSALEFGSDEDDELRRSIISGTPAEVAERIVELAGIGAAIHLHRPPLFSGDAARDDGRVHTAVCRARGSPRSADRSARTEQPRGAPWSECVRA